MMPDLQHLRVLVAEDEFYLANDIALWLERAGATIIGPIPTVQNGARSLEKPVDRGRHSGRCPRHQPERRVGLSVADELARRSVPLIFFSGYHDLSVPERFRSVARLSKCAGSSDLVSPVFEHYFLNMSTLAPLRAGLPDQLVTDLIAGLRLRARVLMSSVKAADSS